MDIVLRPANGSYTNIRAVERIEVGPALTKSRVGRLHGRPYPIQFQKQGAFDAWKQALGRGPEWTRWADPEATCWSIRHEIQHQLNVMDVGRHDSTEADARAQLDAQMQAISISANLKYELQKGAIIEATPALETLLLNSDMDLDLPMRMVAPPYPAQYLKFGPEAARYLKVPDSNLPDRLFDGMFCFFTAIEPPRRCNRQVDARAYFCQPATRLLKRSGRLLGETERDDKPLGEWLNRVLSTAKGRSVARARAARFCCPLPLGRCQTMNRRELQVDRDDVSVRPRDRRTWRVTQH